MCAGKIITPPDSETPYLLVLSELPIRLLEDLQLFDTAAVCTPAYPTGTHVGAGFADQVSSLALAEARNRAGVDSDAYWKARVKQIGEEIRQSENLIGHHNLEIARAELERIERYLNERSDRNTDSPADHTPLSYDEQSRLRWAAKQIADKATKAEYDSQVQEFVNNRPRHSKAEAFDGKGESQWLTNHVPQR